MALGNIDVVVDNVAVAKDLSITTNPFDSTLQGILGCYMISPKIRVARCPRIVTVFVGCECGEHMLEQAERFITLFLLRYESNYIISCDLSLKSRCMFRRPRKPSFDWLQLSDVLLSLWFIIIWVSRNAGSLLFHTL